MAITNGIKIITPSLPAKAIAYIRKATGLSISEIKLRVQSGDYLIQKDLSDDKGLLAMITLANSLSEYGVEVEFYQADYKRPLEFMKNVYESHRDTASEMGLEGD